MTDQPDRDAGGKTGRDAAALDDLRWHWGRAYEISYDGQRWTARRRVTGRVLTSDAPYALRDLMVTDYAGPASSDGDAPDAGRP